MVKRKSKEEVEFGWLDVLGAISLVLFVGGIVVVLLAIFDRYLLPKIIKIILGMNWGIFNECSFRLCLVLGLLFVAVITIFILVLERNQYKKKHLLRGEKKNDKNN